MIATAVAMGFVIGLLTGIGLAWPIAWQEGHDARRH